MWRNNNLISLFIGSFYRLPCPININYFWNFRSTVGIFLIVQILTRLFLTIHYSNDTAVAFSSISHITRDVNYGWEIRYLHVNGASFFLGLIYLHVRRGLYYKRYHNFHAWSIRVVLLIVSMLTAFLGYVLPWGQISYWGATVITNLVSAVPYYRSSIVIWLWRRFSVDNATLQRFYTLHFLFPFVLIFLSLLHLVFIHNVGSGNSLRGFRDTIKIDFWPYFRVKDILRFYIVFLLYLRLTYFATDILREPDNFILANSLVTPVHIIPEWYFLYAYAILRCIPNKVRGVLGLVLSILVLLVIPLSKEKFRRTLIYRGVFFMWVLNFFILTWLGRCPVKEIYVYLAQIGSIIYFRLLILILIL